MSEYASTPLKDLYREVRHLCDNEDQLPEKELCSRLKSILDARPEVVRETDRRRETLLHHAAAKRSVEFCKLLVEKDATLVKSQQIYEYLPIHAACHVYNIETAKYLYQLYPESINIPTDEGLHPLDLLVSYSEEDVKDFDEYVELIRFISKHNQGLLSTPDQSGDLLLHHAIALFPESHPVIIKIVYDCYPEAIFHQDDDGHTPLDIAHNVISAAQIFNFNDDILPFFETQLEFVRQADEQDDPDQSGQRCIHRALQNADVSLGTIKLIIKNNPASISFADNQGLTPLHIACKVGNVEAVEYLAATYEDSLMARDSNGNLPIHIACLEGKCNVVKYLSATFGYENLEGKLPIELLLYEATDCDRDSIEYVDAIDTLLRSNPVEALGRLVE